MTGRVSKRELERRALDIAGEVMELDDAEREAFVASRCGDDLQLRRRVMQLVAADASAPSILDASADQIVERLRLAGPDPLAKVTAVGPYRLLEVIGSGGGGTVYLAERADGAYSQQVAVKFVRFESGEPDERFRRFEAERHVLATMDHPNIARVIDGGVTESEVPYLVMEYVDGVPVTQYCAERRLGLRERLCHFQEICAAVEHAHQRLIVHRDLKPANALVTRDGRVKLLDFGIAKLMAGADTPLNVAPKTRTGLLVMTPEYAAPEQIRNETVTTATDVYALGVMLYELLAGRRPYRIHDKTLTQVEKLVCEVDPPLPSEAGRGAGATSGKTMSAIEQSALRGDLDWIVMRALEKERDRRYSSPRELAEDIGRYLKHEPVLARSPSIGYRAAKFVRRHRAGVAAVLLTVAALVTGILGASIGLLRARQAEAVAEREAATANEVSDFLAAMLGQADPQATGGEDFTVVALLDQSAESLDRLAGEPQVRARLAEVMSGAYLALDQNQRALELADLALSLRSALVGADDVSLLEALRLGSSAYVALGQVDAARERAERATEIAAAGPMVSNLTRARTLTALAMVEREDSNFAEQGALSEEIVDLLEGEAGSEAALLRAEAYNQLGRSAEARSDYDAAIAQYGDALHELGDEPAGRYRRMLIERDLGTLLDMTGRMAEGEERLQASLEIGREVYGNDNANILGSLVLLGRAQTRGGRLAAAQITLDEALSLAARTIGTEHPNYGRTLIDSGWLELVSGKFPAAESMLQDAYRIVSSGQGPDHSTSINIRYRLAYVPYFEGRYPEALSRFQASIDAISARFGADHPFTYGATTFMLAAQASLDPTNLEPMEEYFDGGSAIKDGIFHQRARLAALLAESHYLTGNLDRAAVLIADANRWYVAVSGPEARHYYFDLQLLQAEIDAARGVDVSGALADLGSFLRESGERTGVREWLYRTHLARLRSKQGDSTALGDCIEAIDRLRGIIGAVHPMIARAQTDCAMVALVGQKPGLAADLLAAAAPVLPEAYGEDHWRFAANEAMLAATAQRLDRDGDWDVRRKAGIDKVVQDLGESSPITAALRSL